MTCRTCTRYDLTYLSHGPMSPVRTNPGPTKHYCPRCDFCPLYAHVHPATVPGCITRSSDAPYLLFCPLCGGILDSSEAYYYTRATNGATR